jgi:REP element-mobilizing transposase RayT
MVFASLLAEFDCDACAASGAALTGGPGLCVRLCRAASSISRVMTCGWQCGDIGLAFHIVAWVVLPDHMHCLWTLPQDDADFPSRWRAIKTGFAKSLPIGEPRSPVMTSRGGRHLAAAVLGAHDPRRSRPCGSHGLYAFQPGQAWSRGTRRTGRIRHFAGASLAECIPPTGWAAAMNRNRLANGSEIEAAEAGRATGPLH